MSHFSRLTERLSRAESAFEGLTLNGKVFSREWILNDLRHQPAHRFSEHERQTLELCRRWLSGEDQFVVRTSGSTGQPKDIILKRQQMILSARMTADALKLKAGDRALVCLSPTHIAGLMMLVRGLVLGFDLTVVEPSRDPFETFHLPENARNREPFDFAAFVPLQLQNVLSGGEKTLAFLNKMKAALVGGAPVAFALQKRVQNIKAPIYQTFGMTETLTHIALRRLNGPHPSEAYQALPGVELGKDARGCLTIKSGLTDGHILVTNDLVELKSKNCFVWLGRSDNVINTGGIKVQAERVERAVEEALFELDPDILTNRAFFVGAVPDEYFGEKIAVMFEGGKFPNGFEKALFESLSNKLQGYEVPKAIYVVKSFVRTPNGKIDRKSSLKEMVKFAESR